MCLAAVTAAGLAASPAAAVSTNAVISGKLSVATPQQFKVLYLPTNSSAVKATVASNGTFTLTVKASKTAGASLHLLKSGKYFGPITMRYASGVGALRLAAIAGGAKLSLGTIYASLSKAYGRTLTQLPSNRVDSHKVKVDTAAASIGRPRGAGKLGYVTKSLVASSLSTGSLSTSSVGAQVSNPCAHGATESGAGGDCDADGVPNGVDANTMNAYVAAFDTEDIAATIGGENMFNMYFFVDQNYLGSTAPSAVWVDCASLRWCNATNGTAFVGGVSETPDFDSQLWKGYGGEQWEDGTATALTSPAPSNGLFKVVTDFGTMWVAAVQPRTGATTLTDMVPGQLLNLNSRVGSATNVRTMMLNPYPVSVPAMKSFGAGGAEAADVDYTDESPAGSFGNPIVVDGDGSLAMNFWRPQRQVLPGETGTLRDLGRLHYGMILSAGGQELGCSSDADDGFYDAVDSSFNRTPETGEWAMNLWPLTDKANDAAMDSDNVLSFTLDVRGCLASHDVTIPEEGLDVNATLTAAGEYLTGGANRAAQTLRLHVTDGIECTGC